MSLLSTAAVRSRHATVPALTALTGYYKNLQALLEVCCIPEMFAFTFDTGVERLLGSILSNSVSLVHLYDPYPFVPFEVSESICSRSTTLFTRHISKLEQDTIPEYRELGVSIWLEGSQEFL